MSFSQYLLQHGIVNEEQLLRAYARQWDQLPSLLSIILELEKQKGKSLVKWIDFSAKHKVDFHSALIENQVYTEDEMIEFVNHRFAHRPPLASVLSQMGYVDEDRMKEIQAQYFREIRNRSEAQKTKVVSPQKENIKIIPDFDLIDLDPGMISEYVELFDHTKKEELEKIVLGLMKEENKKESLDILYRELHTLKGTSRFLKAYFSEYLIHQTENLLSGMIRTHNQMTNEIMGVLEDHFLFAMDLIWEIRNIIFERSSERSLIDNPEYLTRVEQFLTAGVRLQTELLQIEEQIDMGSFKDQF